jgi:hypothetical protein
MHEGMDDGKTNPYGQVNPSSYNVLFILPAYLLLLRLISSKLACEFEELGESWVGFISKYAEQQEWPTYLEQHQLVYKESFVKAWVNRHRHYSVTTTSPIEGLHAIAKKWLATS